MMDTNTNNKARQELIENIILDADALDNALEKNDLKLDKFQKRELQRIVTPLKEGVHGLQF
mgnify:CR=1 FL=1